MRIFIIILLSAGVLSCNSDPPIAPNPAEDLVGSWQPDNMNFPFFAADRLSHYLLDGNIDSLTAQARLQTVRTVADAFSEFERIRITEIKSDGTYIDTEGGVGRWAVDLRSRVLNLVDASGRQLKYGIHQSSLESYSKTSTQNA